MYVKYHHFKGFVFSSNMLFTQNQVSFSRCLFSCIEFSYSFFDKRKPMRILLMPKRLVSKHYGRNPRTKELKKTKQKHS